MPRSYSIALVAAIIFELSSQNSLAQSEVKTHLKQKTKGGVGQAIFCTAQQQGGVYCTVTGALQVAGATSLTYCIQGRGYPYRGCITVYYLRACLCFSGARYPVPGKNSHLDWCINV